MIIKAKWILPVSTDPIENGAVVIDGSEIIDIGNAQEILARFKDHEVKDLNMAIVMPGLVDVYTHLEYSIFRGIYDDLAYVPWLIKMRELISRLDGDDFKVSVRLGAMEAIRSGITCVGDVVSTDSGFKALAQSGMRALAFKKVIGMDDAILDDSAKEMKKSISSWVKKAKGTNVEIGIAPHSIFAVSPSFFKIIANYAKEKNMLVCLRLSESMEEINFVEYGSSSLANEYRDYMGWHDVLWQPMGVTPAKYLEQWDVFNCRVMAAHCIHVSKEDIEILKKYNVAVAYCPRTNAKLGTGIAPLTKYFAEGLNVGLGTDNLASSNNMDFYNEMRIGLLLQRGMARTVENLSAKDFVYMATMGGAKCLGLEDRIGSIEPGKQADIIAIDASHSHQMPMTDPYSNIVYTVNQEDVELTIIAGKTVYENSQWFTIDKEDVVAKVDAVRGKLS